MLTWTRKRAFVSWSMGIYAFFPCICAYFPGKYAHNFAFKMHKVQKCQVVRLRSCGEKPLKKQKSLKWAFFGAFSRVQVVLYLNQLVSQRLRLMKKVFNISVSSNQKNNLYATEDPFRSWGGSNEKIGTHMQPACCGLEDHSCWDTMNLCKTDLLASCSSPIVRETSRNCWTPVEVW